MPDYYVLQSYNQENVKGLRCFHDGVAVSKDEKSKWVVRVACATTLVFFVSLGIAGSRSQGVQPVNASASVVVTTTADSGPGSLRQAILDADPLLGSLQDNGGATMTHLPAAGSPTIDAGNAAVVFHTPSPPNAGALPPPRRCCIIGRAACNSAAAKQTLSIETEQDHKNNVEI